MDNVECGAGVSTLVKGVEKGIREALKWSEKYKVNPSSNADYTPAQIVALVKIFEGVNLYHGNLGKALEFTSWDVEVVGWLQDTYNFMRKDVYMIFESWSNSDPFMISCVFDMNRKYKTLHMAVLENNTQMVEWLLYTTIDVDTRDDDERTPLHIAAENGHKMVVQMLLLKGASVFKMDIEGQCPFHLAFDRFHFECADLLYPAVFVSGRLLGGKTLLAHAVEDGNHEKIEYLSQYSTPLMMNQALCLAAHKGYPKVIEALLKDNNCHLNYKDEDGYTALDLAVFGNYPEVVERLLGAGAQPNEELYRHEKKKYMEEVVNAIHKYNGAEASFGQGTDY